MGPIEVKTEASIKGQRQGIDAFITEVRKAGDTTAPATNFDSELYFFAEGQVLRALIEAKMWYGKMIEGLGQTPFPAQFADKAGTGGASGSTTMPPGMGGMPSAGFTGPTNGGNTSAQ